jgi:enamine deaminase RidA (YjgF/YER057c/UK114 family)
MQQYLIQPVGMPPTNGYSHVVAFTGTTLMISGQAPLDAEGRLVGPDDIRAQTRQVFHNLQMALAGRCPDRRSREADRVSDRHGRCRRFP